MRLLSSRCSGLPKQCLVSNRKVDSSSLSGGVWACSLVWLECSTDNRVVRSSNLRRPTFFKMKSLKFENISKNSTIDLSLDTIKIGKQALVFVNTKRGAEKTAEDIAKKIEAKKEALDKLSEGILKSLSRPTKQCERLAYCIKKGIAFHHAGLVAKQRELIEDNFRKGLIRIICCTPTLAYGLDLPAFRAIIRDLRRYTPRGYTWIPVLEYLQQSGRAGRPKFDKYGEAIAIASTKPEREEIIERYIKGKPEEIYSKLAVEPVLRTYVLSLVATGFARNKKELMDFFKETFWAHQYKDMQSLEDIIDKILHLLEEFEFIKTKKQDFVSADKIKEERIVATILGKRVSELYIDPLTANHLINCLRKATGGRIKPFSFLQMVSSTLEMRPLLRTRTKEYDDMQETLIKYEEYFLQKEPSLYEPGYDDFLDSIKTALFFDSWINENDEEYLLERFNIRPGEIRIKISLADWLLYASEEIAKLLQFHSLVKEIVKLRFRLKYGVREELLPLLKLKEVGRVRARKLYFNKIKDIGDVKRAELATLVQILGKQIALNVKKQVGQDISKLKVKEKKKKGQISLKDY